MDIFNDNDLKESSLEPASFEDMLKERKKAFDKIKQSVKETLKDYDGGMLAVLVMKEDENGMPSGAKVFLGGVGRPETQIELARALSQASDKALDIMLAEAKKDPIKFISLAKQLIEFMGGEK